MRLALVGVALQSLYVGAVAGGMAVQAKETAQRNYQSATVKIASVTEVDMLECGTRRGPAAKACEIQANGKRLASEDQAKLARDRASDEVPSSDVEKQKLVKHVGRVAKISYGMDKARIAKEHKQARAQCDELKGDERKTCHLEVASRTDEAKREAKSSYERSVGKAKESSAR